MSAIALDMKLSLTVINEIIKENRGNKEIIDACKFVVGEFKKEINKGTDDVKSYVNPTKIFALHRTKLMLNLLSDSFRYGNNVDEDAVMKIGIIIELVKEKINEEEQVLDAQGEGRK